LQETFLRAYRLLHEVDDARTLRPWLYAIARNVCAERRRSAARRRKHEHAAAKEQVAMNGSSSLIHPSGGTRREPPVHAPAAHAEALTRLTAALDGLPDDERLAIHLYYLDSDPVAA